MQPTLSGPGPHHFSHVLAVKLRTRMKRAIIRLSPSQVALFYHRSVIEVDCYAGHRGEETPRRFVVDGVLDFKAARVLTRDSQNSLENLSTSPNNGSAQLRSATEIEP